MIQQVVINIMNAGSFFYFIKSSLKGMYKNALMTIASVFVLMACMLIIGSVFLASENVLSFMNKLEAQNEIVAFIDDDYGEDSLSREQLCDKVRAVAGVSDVEYVTREQAFAEYRDSLGANREYLDGYDGEDNPLRNELRIHISDIELFESVVGTVSAMDEIANIRDSQDVVDMLLSMRRMLNMLGFWILVILAVVSLFIISNTVKLTMHSRRNEINIMKYVGATNGFIRFPFLLEGVIIGVVATVLAIAAQWCIYVYALIPAISQLTFLSDCIVSFRSATPGLLIIFGAIGLVVGVFGSMLSIRKYLKV